jgi:hypothetical protein
VKRDQVVRLGYQVGTGDVVEIPVRHMCVTGQTQEAGKTTTLEALITRSGLRALTFVTKPGEGAFGSGHLTAPYFEEQLEHRWRFVAAILEAHLGERLKFERNWIEQASRGTKTLDEVRRQARTLSETSRGGMNQDQFRMLAVYLDELVPAIAGVQWAKAIALQPGVNVMDLETLSTSLQHLAIKSALEWVLKRERDVVVVIPEAWQFIPQGRNTPVKLATSAFARQGAARGNFLWLDSQDLGGVEKEILRNVAVWLLGVQREANEIKRTLESIPKPARPKAEDVMTLELGEFVACWGSHAIRTYVQPAGMPDAEARGRALGKRPRTVWRPPARKVSGKDPGVSRKDPGVSRKQSAVIPLTPVEELPGRNRLIDEVKAFVGRGQRAQRAVDHVITDTHRAHAIKEHLAYHGPGLTFGELAIGERFEWAAPIPRGPEPLTKTAADRYEFGRRASGIGGYGTAEDYYRVERALEQEADTMTPAQEKKLDALLESVNALVATRGTNGRSYGNTSTVRRRRARAPRGSPARSRSIRRISTGSMPR